MDHAAAPGHTPHARAVVAHYDQRAATYDDSPMHRGLVEAIADLPELSSATAVLDVATGTGLMLRALAARDPDRALTGVDLSPVMLAVARRALPEGTFALADAAHVPAADGSADLVTCVTALHLFERPADVFSEWARILRPGGLAVTATFAPPADIDAQPHPAGFVRRHEAYRTPEQVADTLAPYGFAPVRHERWSHGADRLIVSLLRRG